MMAKLGKRTTRNGTFTAHIAVQEIKRTTRVQREPDVDRATTEAGTAVRRPGEAEQKPGVAQGSDQRTRQRPRREKSQSRKRGTRKTRPDGLMLGWWMRRSQPGACLPRAAGQQRGRRISYHLQPLRFREGHIHPSAGRAGHMGSAHNSTAAPQWSVRACVRAW